MLLNLVMVCLVKAEHVCEQEGSLNHAIFIGI